VSRQPDGRIPFRQQFWVSVRKRFEAIFFEKNAVVLGSGKTEGKVCSANSSKVSLVMKLNKQCFFFHADNDVY